MSRNNKRDEAENRNILKIILIALWCVVLLAFVALTYNYVRTYKASIHFYRDMLRVSDLSELGFISPYKNHYNLGTAYMSEGDTESAESEFRKALESKHPDDEDKDCKIRINLALSMVKPLTRDSINAENVDLAIEILKEARDILCENGCADYDNKEWHDDDAQTLKEEIDEYIKELEEQKEQQQQQDQQDQNNGGGGGGGGGSDDGDDSNGNDDENNGSDGDDQQNGGGNQDPNDDILDQLDDIMNQGQQDRSDLSDSENMFNYDYYGGKSW